MWSDNVRYYLYSKELGRVLVPEPVSYKDGNGAKYRRDPQSKGVMRQNSNELEFFGEAYDYLFRINTIYGVVPDVRVDKWYKDDTRLDQRWTYIGSFGLDITNLKFTHKTKTVKVSYTNGGLADKIQSRFREEYDLLIEESVGGVDIGPLQTVLCSLPGKAIFLESKLVVDEGRRVQTVVSGSDFDNARAIPFEILTNPDGTQFNNDTTNVYSVTDTPIGRVGGSFASGNEFNIIYLIAERPRQLKLSWNINFTFYDTDIGSLDFGIIVYDGGIDLNFKQFIPFETINTNGTQSLNSVVNDYILNVAEGESWTLGYKSITSDGFGVQYGPGVKLSIVDEQPAPPSVTRALTFKYTFERLMERAFGQSNIVESELLTTGEFGETLKTCGLFIRQFPDVVNEGTDEERRTQFKTSLAKQLDSANAIHPVAWWVAKSGDREVLRIERLDYTQQGFTGIHYGERQADGRIKYIPPQKVERVMLPDNYYSSAQIGSIKTGDNYEDFYGLTSFCGNATYNFINDSKGSQYVMTTEDRTGDLDIEIIRRKPYDKFPDTDTDMDDDIFFIDAKLTATGMYVPRTWQDDFDSVPLNVYSPDTAFNFRYTPVLLLLNHSYVLNAGLFHYPFEYARLASSNCNPSITLEPKGEDIITGNQPIQHTRFKKNRIRPMMVEFDMPVPFEVEQQINGFQKDGTPNWFGRVAVEIDGIIEYMRLVDVDTNKEGKHKMVESA